MKCGTCSQEIGEDDPHFSVATKRGVQFFHLHSDYCMAATRQARRYSSTSTRRWQSNIDGYQ